MHPHMHAMVCTPRRKLFGLRGSANRRVAYVSRNDGKAVESLLELPSKKSCQPIGGSSKLPLTLLLATWRQIPVLAWRTLVRGVLSWYPVCFAIRCVATTVLFRNLGE